MLCPKCGVENITKNYCYCKKCRSEYNRAYNEKRRKDESYRREGSDNYSDLTPWHYIPRGFASWAIITSSEYGKYYEKIDTMGERKKC